MRVKRVLIVVLVAGLIGVAIWGGIYIRQHAQHNEFIAWEKRFSQLQQKKDAYERSVSRSEQDHFHFLDDADIARIQAHTEAYNTEGEAFRVEATFAPGSRMESLKLHHKAERMHLEADGNYNVTLAGEKRTPVLVPSLSSAEQAEYKELEQRVTKYKIDHHQNGS